MSQETQWKTGTPEQPGLYKCLENGKETVLHFKRCIYTKRMYWLHVDGSDVNPNADIKWSMDKVFED